MDRLTIILLVVIAAIAWQIGEWAVGPLDKAAKARQHPTQFTIVDFFCLFILIQVPTGLIHSLTLIQDKTSLTLRFILDGYAWLSCGLIWWKCVQIMSRAGIHRP